MFIFAAVIVACISPSAAPAAETAASIPAGVHVKFHVLAPISSNKSKTGQTFGFKLLQPIAVAGGAIPTQGTTGSGTICLAGHAGTSGHEGDLTLRLDVLHTADGRTVTFADQRFELNGRNRKVVAGVLGFVPVVGLGATFIRGAEIRVDPTTPIETILARPATISFHAKASPVPVPSPSAH